MSKLQSPCLNCTDRNLNCHSNCSKYLKFKILNELLREKRNKEKQFEQDWYGFKEAKFKRINRKLNNGR